MFEWLATNWTTVVLALVVLACPLMHFVGHSHGGRHPHRRPDERERRS